jgi:hypothetical protein
VLIKNVKLKIKKRLPHSSLRARRAIAFCSAGIPAGVARASCPRPAPAEHDFLFTFLILNF